MAGRLSINSDRKSAQNSDKKKKTEKVRNPIIITDDAVAHFEILRQCFIGRLDALQFTNGAASLPGPSSLKMNSFIGSFAHFRGGQTFTANTKALMQSALAEPSCRARSSPITIIDPWDAWAVARLLWGGWRYMLAVIEWSRGTALLFSRYSSPCVSCGWGEGQSSSPWRSHR